MVPDPPRDPRRFGSRPRRDPRRTGPRPKQDRDVGLWSRRDRDETLVRLETVSRPRRRDRDHIRDSYSKKCLSMWIGSAPEEHAFTTWTFHHLHRSYLLKPYLLNHIRWCYLANAVNILLTSEPPKNPTSRIAIASRTIPDYAVRLALSQQQLSYTNCLGFPRYRYPP